jgi:hypothetical protein
VNESGAGFQFQIGAALGCNLIWEWVFVFDNGFFFFFYCTDI